MITRPALLEHLDRTAIRKTTALGDGGIVWRLWGSGEPLVLLHGGTGSWMHWMRNIEPLARDYQLLVPDLPGSGESATPPMPTSAEQVATAVVRGIDTLLGPQRPFRLVGFSMGGLVAGYAAKLAAARIAHLVLVGAVGTTSRRAAMKPMKSWRRLGSDAEKLEAHRYNLAILMVRDPAALDEASLYMQHHNAERSRVRGKHLRPTGDLARTLPGLGIRVSGIWGEHDATAAPYVEERREKLAQFCPGSTFDVVPGAGHWVQFEAADAFNTVLLRRLAG